MTPASGELFELCKQVYEATGWDGTEKCYAFIDEFGDGGKHWRVIPLHEDNVDDVDEWHPLYTSDYLLEKLAKDVTLDGATAGTWQARKFYRNADGKQIPVYSEADTPLKALLKLTIKLHEEGLL